MFLECRSHCRSPHTINRYNTKQPEAADCLFMDLSSNTSWTWMNVLSLSTGRFTHTREDKLDIEHFPEDTEHRRSKWRRADRSICKRYSFFWCGDDGGREVALSKTLAQTIGVWKFWLWFLKSEACAQILQGVLLTRRTISCLLI